MRNTDLIKTRPELRCRNCMLYIRHTLADDGHFYLIHVKLAQKDLEILWTRKHTNITLIQEQLVYKSHMTSGIVVLECMVKSMTTLNSIDMFIQHWYPQKPKTGFTQLMSDRFIDSCVFVIRLCRISPSQHGSMKTNTCFIHHVYYVTTFRRSMLIKYEPGFPQGLTSIFT